MGNPLIAVIFLNGWSGSIHYKKNMRFPKQRKHSNFMVPHFKTKSFKIILFSGFFSMLMSNSNIILINLN